MNKYNVRAIRKDLDDCILHAKWKQFQSRFRMINQELKKAIIDYQPNSTNNSRKRSKKQPSSSSSLSSNGKSLVHALCRCGRFESLPPLEVFEEVIRACPPHILSLKPTPLSVLLQNGKASIAAVQCLLKCDVNRQQTLSCIDGNGETPLLQAVKKHGSTGGMGEDIVRILVQHDAPRYESLLVESCHSRCRVPLYYMANHDWWFVENPGRLPELLEYILVRTHRALDIQTGRMQPLLEGDDLDCTDTIHVSDNRNDGSQWQDTSLETRIAETFHLLSSTIACAHLMGNKHTGKIVRYLLENTDHSHDLLSFLDGQGETLLHHIARATNLFQMPMIERPSPVNDKQDDDVTIGEPVGLLEYLLTTTPHCLLKYNKSGQLPIHAAIEMRKPWVWLHHLVEAAPNTLELPTQGLTPPKHGVGRVALHLAINHFSGLNENSEIEFIWKRYPEAAGVRDPYERLYPFQLIANSHSTKERGQKATKSTKTALSKTSQPKAKSDVENETETENFELVSLSSSFLFLRACPQVLDDYSRRCIDHSLNRNSK